MFYTKSTQQLGEIWSMIGYSSSIIYNYSTMINLSSAMADHWSIMESHFPTMVCHSSVTTNINFAKVNHCISLK